MLRNQSQRERLEPQIGDPHWIAVTSYTPHEVQSKERQDSGEHSVSFSADRASAGGHQFELFGACHGLVEQKGSEARVIASSVSNIFPITEKVQKLQSLIRAIVASHLVLLRE